MKYPLFVSRYGVHKLFGTHRLPYGRTDPNTECLRYRFFDGGGGIESTNWGKQSILEGGMRLLVPWIGFVDRWNVEGSDGSVLV